MKDMCAKLVSVKMAHTREGERINGMRDAVLEERIHYISSPPIKGKEYCYTYDVAVASY